MEKQEINVLELGHSYELPSYKVTENGLEEADFKENINFARGSKDSSEEDRREGTLPAHVIEMLITDLSFKNREVPSPETSMMIFKLQEALAWAALRQKDRSIRGVLQTYKK